MPRVTASVTRAADGLAGSGAGLVRPELRDLPPVPHGSVSAAELQAYGLAPANVLDFSVNTNPLGPADIVLQAIQHADWTRYPGDDEAPLRLGLAQRAGLDTRWVALGNGSAELVWLVCLAVLRPGERVAVLGPTFGEYARAAGAVGAEVTLATQGLPPARLAFVCNPNNPSGAYCRLEDVRDLLAADPRRVLVLDEAYAAFVDDRWPSEALLAAHPNLIILRSLTKDHAVPGLRLGYLLGVPEAVQAIEAVRPPWSVNAGALRAGLAALTPEAQAHVERACRLVATSRRLLTRGFLQRGFSVAPSRANFVLVEVGDAAAFRRSLLARGLVVRDCASFGLQAHVRVACRLPEECQRLLDAIP
jgi:histidinol-phosphate aminotransferase